MTRRMLVGLALSALTVAAAAPPAPGAAGWVRPVDGPVIRAFAVGSDRFAAGQHRGVDLAAPLGSTVRSACAGRVSFAGRVPAGGLTVSVRCGRFVATYQHLGAVVVGRGAGVGRATRLGVVGQSGRARTTQPHVHLGVRVAATGRYLDPLSLLGGGGVLVLPPPVPPVAGPREPPRGPAPVSVRSRPVVAPRWAPVPVRVGVRPVVAPRWAPVPVRVGVRPVVAPQWAPVPVRVGVRPLVAPQSAPARGRARSRPLPGGRPVPARPEVPAQQLPWTVWIGLGCVGLGLPIGGVVRLRRSRQRRASALVTRTA